MAGYKSNKENEYESKITIRMSGILIVGHVQIFMYAFIIVIISLAAADVILGIHIRRRTHRQQY